jgi:hypothetical protein
MAFDLLAGVTGLVVFGPLIGGAVLLARHLVRMVR